jgi:hypothetical protein
LQTLFALGTSRYWVAGSPQLVLPSRPAILDEEDKQMLETFFQRSFAMRRLRHGPLAGHIDVLADRLAAEGYSRVHSRIQLRHIGHFNRWLQQEHLSLEQLDENIIERYWRYFMREKRVRPKDVFALMKLLDLLREQ